MKALSTKNIIYRNIINDIVNSIVLWDLDNIDI